jgi:hypothetical protein
MSFYSNKIKDSTKRFNNYMVELSNYIKSFGGYGTIHGCIIDIDFYNHVFVNPLDGKITPYFANSMTDKYVYENLPSLLKNECPLLYDNYQKTLENKANSLILFNKNEIESSTRIPVASTDMYKISRIIKGLQHTVDNNVVRIWNDTLLCDPSEEKGKLIVSNIISSNKSIEINKTNRLE